MVNKLIREISMYFPLRVNSIAWNRTTLHLIGDGWDFSTTGSWRIVIDKVLDFACCDDEALEALAKIDKDSIISIGIQSKYLSVDPVFVFSNGCKLEIFSTARTKPWTFRSPSGALYVADFS